MPILFHNGDAHASVTVDRNGLTTLSITTMTTHNLKAHGVLGDSSLLKSIVPGGGPVAARQSA
jgi:hypothetical protein